MNPLQKNVSQIKVIFFLFFFFLSKSNQSFTFYFKVTSLQKRVGEIWGWHTAKGLGEFFTAGY